MRAPANPPAKPLGRLALTFVALLLATVSMTTPAKADEPSDAEDTGEAAVVVEFADGASYAEDDVAPAAADIASPEAADAPTLASYLAGGMLRVSADVALVDGDDEAIEPVVGSFTVDGLTYAIIGEGKVALVAVSPRTLAGGLVGGSDAALNGSSDGAPSGEDSGSGVPPRSGAEQVPSGATSPSPSPEGASSDDSGDDALALPETVSYDGIDYPLTAIGPRALAGCDAGAVVIPASVETVDQAAFEGSPIASVEVADGNPDLSSFDGMLFDADRTRLLLVPEGKQGAARIPKEAEVVDPSCFSHSAGVSSIDVEAGSAAFSSRNGCLYDASGETLIFQISSRVTGKLTRDGFADAVSRLSENIGRFELARIFGRCVNGLIDAPLAASSVGEGMMEKTSKDGLEGRNGAPTFRFRVAAGSSDSSSAPWLRVNDAGVVEGLAGTCYFERDLDRSAFRTLKRGAYGFEAISAAGVRFVIYAGSASADSLIGQHISSLRTWDVAAYSTNIHKPETFFDPAVGWEASSSITTWITLVPGERAKVNWSGNGGRLAWSDTDETFSGLRDLVFGYGVYGLNAYLVPAVKKHETLHFMGWSDRETGSIIGALGSSAEVDFPYLTEREVTYYAQWGHEITWDAAGGFFSEGSVNQPIASEIVKPNGNSTCPEPYRSKCLFAGWAATSEPVEGEAVLDGGELLTEVNSDRTYYARWACRVAWDAQSSSFETQESTVAYGKDVIAPNLTLPGWKLLGWYDKPIGGSKVCNPGESIENITENATLYGYWQRGATIEFLLADDPSRQEDACVTWFDERSSQPSTGSSRISLPFFPEASYLRSPMMRREANGTTFLTTSTLGGTGHQILTTDSYATEKNWPSDYTVYDIATYQIDDGSAQILPVGGTLDATDFSPSSHLKVYLTKGKACRVAWDDGTGNLQVKWTGAGRNLQGGSCAAPFASRQGYVLEGWYDHPTGGNRICEANGIANGITYDSIYYAHWRQAPKLSLLYADDPDLQDRLCWLGYDEAFGGPTSYEGTTDIPLNRTDLWPLQRVSFGTTHDGLSRRGVVFQDGSRILASDVFYPERAWPDAYSCVDVAYYCVDGGEPKTLAVGEVLHAEDFEENATVTAYVTVGTTHKVTWNSNGGLIGNYDTTDGWGSPYRGAKAPKAVRYGYTLDGWYDNSDSNKGNRICGADSFTPALEEDMTLYAHWTMIVDVEVPIALGAAGFELGVPDGTVRVAGTDGDERAPGYLRSSMPVEVAVESVSCEAALDASGAAPGTPEAFWAEHAAFADLEVGPGERAGGATGAAGGDGAGGADAADGTAGAGGSDAAGAGDGPSALAATGALSLRAGSSLAGPDLPAWLSIPAATGAPDGSMASLGELPLLYGLSLERLLADPSDGGAGVDIVDLLPQAPGSGFAVPTGLLRVTFTVDATRYA